MDGDRNLLDYFLTPLAVSFGIILVVFVVYGIAERLLLEEYFSGYIDVFHIVRGVISSLLVAVFLIWNYFEKDALSLGRDVLRFPVDERSVEDPQHFHELFSRWLIQLRWVALVAAGGAIYFAGFLTSMIPSEYRSVTLFSLVGLLALVNVGYYYWNQTHENYEFQNLVQMVVDLIFLTLLLHFSGGLTNPFYLLYIFHVILGCIVFLPRTAVLFSTLSGGFLILLAVLEYSGVVAHHPIDFGFLPGREVLIGSFWFVISRLGTFLIVLVGVTGFATSLMEIIRRSRGKIMHETKRRERLLQKVLSAQEEERARVARELHDQIGQSLSALQMKVSRLLKGQDDLPRELQELKDDIEVRIEEVRSLSSQIRPPSLEDCGLPNAIANHVKEINEQFDPEIEFDYTRISYRENFTYPVDIAIYRVMQEAVHNAITHGEPDRINILLQKVGDSLRMQVYDDGVGFDVEEMTQKDDREFLGIQGMQERITHVDGEFEIHSKPGEGTRVRVSVPLPDN